MYVYMFRHLRACVRACLCGCVCITCFQTFCTKEFGDLLNDPTFLKMYLAHKTSMPLNPANNALAWKVRKVPNSSMGCLHSFLHARQSFCFQRELARATLFFAVIFLGVFLQRVACSDIFPESGRRISRIPGVVGTDTFRRVGLSDALSPGSLQPCLATSSQEGSRHRTCQSF